MLNAILLHVSESKSESKKEISAKTSSQEGSTKQSSKEESSMEGNKSNGKGEKSVVKGDNSDSSNSLGSQSKREDGENKKKRSPAPSGNKGALALTFRGICITDLFCFFIGDFHCLNLI